MWKNAEKGRYFLVQDGKSGAGVVFDVLCVKIHQIAEKRIGLFLDGRISMTVLGLEEEINDTPFFFESKVHRVEVDTGA